MAPTGRSLISWICAATLVVIMTIGSIQVSHSRSNVPDLSESAKNTLLSLQRLRGPELRPEDLRGRIVLVSFVASWCGPCWQELSSFNRVAERRRGESVTLVAVNAFEDWLGGSNPAKRALFLDRASGAYPLLEAVEGSETPFGVTGLPAFIAYDRTGKRIDLELYRRGPRTRYATVEEIEALIDRMQSAGE